MANVLLVEDDSELRKALRLNLEEFGHKVVEAGDGREAMLLFRSVGADIVVTDLVMPEKEGLETISEFRRHRPELPIVAMSGGGRIAPGLNLSMALRLGARRVLLKPFPISELDQAVTELTGKGAGGSQGSPRLG
jgi:DNA-binding response OmpR family regulator